MIDHVKIQLTVVNPVQPKPFRPLLRDLWAAAALGLVLFITVVSPSGCDNAEQGSGPVAVQQLRPGGIPSSYDPEVKRLLDEMTQPEPPPDAPPVWRSGALMGLTAGEAFFVKCDRTTMTQDDIDNGRLICYIGIAPVKPAEFVIFRISQKTMEEAS